MRYRTRDLDTALFSTVLTDALTAHTPLLEDYIHSPPQASMDTVLSILHTCMDTAAHAACPLTNVRPGQNPWWKYVQDRELLQREYRRATSVHRTVRPANRTPSMTAEYFAAKSAWMTAIKHAKATDTVNLSVNWTTIHQPWMPQCIHPLTGSQCSRSVCGADCGGHSTNAPGRLNSVLPWSNIMLPTYCRILRNRVLIIWQLHLHLYHRHAPTPLHSTHGSHLTLKLTAAPMLTTLPLHQYHTRWSN